MKVAKKLMPNKSNKFHGLKLGERYLKIFTFELDLSFGLSFSYCNKIRLLLMLFQLLEPLDV
jgi:hypothetical protein